MLGFLLISTHISFAGQSETSIDISKADSGLVMVKHESSKARAKIMIEKDGIKYTYDLQKDSENFPLQLGRGYYRVTIYENIGGNKYKGVESESFNVNLPDENSPFLQSVQAIDWSEAVNAVKKAKDLTKDCTEDIEKLEAIYNYIVHNLKYDLTKKDAIAAGYVPDIDKIVAAGGGICYDFSSVMAGMLRSVGIPAKLIKGYSKVTTVYHSWNEVYINGRWMIVDTSYDSQMNSYKSSYAMEKPSSWYDKKYEY